MKLWKKMKCKLGNHEYVVTREITESVSELKCKNCGKEFGINHDIHCILPLDKELKDMHDFILGVKGIDDIQ